MHTLRERRRSFRVYRVERVKGRWLWLVPEKEGISGWARAAQVVPYDQAIDDFTEPTVDSPGQARRHRAEPVLRSSRLGLLAREAGVRQGHRRLRRGDPARSQRRLVLIATGALPGDGRRSSTRPSPITTRRSGSIPSTPRRTTAGASPGESKGSSTRPSPTTTRRSGSIPRTPWRTTTGA